MRNAYSVGMLYACKGAHGRDRVRTPSSLVRERVRKRGRESEKEGERQSEKEGERERERCRICSELLFLFLKGIMGALAPFSCLVF
jgi:hypothetical protein